MDFCAGESTSTGSVMRVQVLFKGVDSLPIEGFYYGYKEGGEAKEFLPYLEALTGECRQVTEEVF